MFIENYTIYEIKNNIADIFAGSGSKLDNVYIENSLGESYNITKIYDSLQQAKDVLDRAYPILKNGVYTILPIYIKE